MGEGGTVGAPPYRATSQRVVINFDGSTEEMEDVTEEDLVAVGSNKFTIATWIRPPVQVGNYSSPWSFITTAGNASTLWGFMLRDDKLSSRFGVMLSEKAWAAPWNKWYAYTQLTRNVWSHVTVTFDGDALSDGGKDGRVCYYLNGILQTPLETVGDDDIDTSSGISPVLANAAGYLPPFANKWNGYLYDCAIWDGAMTAAEALAIYNSGNPLDYSKDSSGIGYTKSADLYHYFRLGYNPADMGKDYGVAAGDKWDLMDNAANITTADIFASWPGE
jgi:hypothetical protein